MMDAVAAPTPAPSNAAELTRLARAHAYALGFDLVGIAELGPAETAAAYDAWIAEGRAGAMHYLERGAEKRRDSRLPLAGTTHAIVVAMDYGGDEPPGPVARYARGDDYHDVMESRLRELHRRVERDAGRAVLGKPYVDTGPLLERDLARRAGLGWFGKNTMLVHPQRGSFFFLGALVLDLALEPDAPFEADRCGTCTRCLEACPTQAITAPRQLDARRCISYLTIELREGIPEELREAIGDRLYGCDVCQEVCPYNQKFATELSEPAFAARPALSGKDARSLALELLAMSQPEFSLAFKGSPMKRAKLRGLARNSAVVLGNAGSKDDLPALVAALAHGEPLIRAHAAWALGKLGSPEAAEPLRVLLSLESKGWVSREAQAALDALGG